MKSNPPNSSSLSVKRRALLCAFALAALVASAACQSGGGAANSDSRGIIVVNAPVTGTVRRVLVREGVAVNEGAAIVEIAVQTEQPTATPSPGESAEARAARNFKAADAEIDAARAEAVRHEAEVERLTPLVASGQASQAQLDGERALYEHAQQRLQKAQDAKKGAESGLLVARQSSQNQGSAPAPREQTVAARATSAGTVSVINARVGDRVTAGQPLATLRANQ
jgi:multidrug efflux pump subunit AcrA (membrane-fusion protein)